jgi:predicted Zn-dependent protease with MMP-like domain
MRLTYDQFTALVEQALASLPPQFSRLMENVVVEVQGHPSRKVLEEAQASRDELLGYYDGVPLTEKTVEAAYDMPERILLFKDNIESICATREEVVEQVRQTLLHEIGHHFGMDEDDLEELGYG